MFATARGSTFRWMLNQWGVRGEGAYVRLSALGIIPQTAPQSYFYSVLGVEHDLGASMYVNVQWLHQNVFHFTNRSDIASPLRPLANGNSLIFNQFDRRQDGIAVRLSEKWLNDSLQAEIAGVYLFNHRDYVMPRKYNMR